MPFYRKMIVKNLLKKIIDDKSSSIFEDMLWIDADLYRTHLNHNKSVIPNSYSTQK